MRSFKQHILREQVGAPCDRHYDGEPLETGGTSIQGGASPGIKRLFKKGQIQPGQIVLDYGAGKYGRNADFLRENGVTVYAFDPFNGDPNESGWQGVAKNQPLDKSRFDTVFTAFVINVVPYHIEQTITNELKQYSNAREFHLTRNMDIFDTVKKALMRQDDTVGSFFLNEFADEELAEAYRNGTLTDEQILKFCCFGVETTRGFQRIPYMEENGYNILANTKGYKIYYK